MKHHRTLSRSLFSLTVVLVIMSALFLWGCDDDDDDFEDVDASAIENQTYTFPDARAFGLPNQQATLSIGQFGTTASGDTDDAPFTLVSGTSTVTGILDFNQPTIPIGSRETDCDFGIETSPFTVDGLRPGDTIDTVCLLTQGDATELQITNQATSQVSTGTRQ
jgi:hypothetical protein